MEERTELSLKDLQELAKDLHLEEEMDMMEIGRCTSCCSERNGGTC